MKIKDTSLSFLRIPRPVWHEEEVQRSQSHTRNGRSNWPPHTGPRPAQLRQMCSPELRVGSLSLWRERRTNVLLSSDQVRTEDCTHVCSSKESGSCAEFSSGVNNGVNEQCERSAGRKGGDDRRSQSNKWRKQSHRPHGDVLVPQMITGWTRSTVIPCTCTHSRTPDRFW